MLSRQEFTEKAIELTRPHIGTHTAFWFDVDFVEFKVFNHHYGIDQGDIVLASAQKFLDDIPNVILSKRIFSDEFVFLIITGKPMTDAEIVQTGNSYLEKFIRKHQKNYPAFKLRLSCGICPVSSETSPMELIDNASMARKQARNSNSYSAVIFTQDMLDQIENLRMKEKELSLALEERQFTFDLQPKVELNTGKIVGAEALARRILPNGERAYPDSFMSVMERNGSVIDLDFLILEKVCFYLENRIKKSLPVVRTSVNLSRLHLQDPDAAKKFNSIVQRHNIPYDLIEFELTETVFLDELTGAKALMEQLRDYGYYTSIDDFGSGYAGLNLCQEVDFDIIKLDRKFLTDEAQIKRKNEAIVPCIVDMMQRIDISVLCEGVERPDQCEFLQQAGCHIVQGYYFSKPIPPDEFYKNYQAQNGYYI